jgi:hypothetical protein
MRAGDRWWLILPLLLLCTPCDALKLTLRGEAALPIILAPDASLEEQTAARELVHYLSAVSGARFRIKTMDTVPDSESAILVGRAAAEHGTNEFPALAPEEWVVRSTNRRLLIYGGAAQAERAGVRGAR